MIHSALLQRPLHSADDSQGVILSYIPPENSAPGEARTRNLWIRSPLLYPIELRGRGTNYTMSKVTQ